MDGRKCRYKGFFDPPNASAKKKVSFNVENENIEDDSALKYLEFSFFLFIF